MISTSLTYNGYSIPKKDNEQLISSLKEELTVSPYNGFDSDDRKVYSLFRENDKKLYVPKNFGLSKFGIPQRDLLLNTGIDCPRLHFNGSLRDEQKHPVNSFLDAAYNPLKRGGIISVPCAGGKTVMALYIACQIKKKTLFVVHKDFLGTQFQERASQFVPTASIGIIKQNKVDVEDKDFVIASLQSLAMREYDLSIFQQFGLVIIDECHHTSAEVFSKALIKICAPIMMGLSATLNRKDGLRKVFEWFLGKPVFKPNNKPLDSDLLVNMINYYDDNSDYNQVKKLWNGKINLVSMLNNICSYEPRNVFISNIINDILFNENERQILVLSERRSQLSSLEKLLHNFTIGYYIGGLSREQLKISETKQIILATYHMASEGMDIPSLNTLILASPISSIEQSIGRIQRQRPENRQFQPLCIDIVDNFSVFLSRSKTRLNFYKLKKYTIKGEKKEPKEIKYNYIEEEDVDTNL